MTAGAGEPTVWQRCPFCPHRLPTWAGRAQWEHVDQAHRDDGPADTPWTDESEQDVSSQPQPVSHGRIGPETNQSINNKEQ